jgi:hypothetical protein
MNDNRKTDPPRDPRPVDASMTDFSHRILIMAAISLGLILLGVVLGRMF